MIIKTGILCHGRHLLANNWELHQFGDEKNGLLGQITKTLDIANKENPELIVFGTGASEKEGLKESEFTIKYMLDNFDKLNYFKQFKNTDTEKFKNFIEKISIPEKTSQNTYEEIKAAVEIFSSEGIEKTIIVSNPDHIPRCMQMAHQVYQETKAKPLEYCFGVQSEVGYNGTAVVTSKVIEMPHRGDDKSPDLSAVIGQYFGLPQERKEKLVNIINDFIKE